MNDKDKKAFEKWWEKNRGDLVLEPSCFITIKDREQYLWEEEAFQAACEYKDKEIIELKKKVQMNIHNSAFNGLLAENKKLREALEYIQNNTDSSYIFNWAEEALKKE